MVTKAGSWGKLGAGDFDFQNGSSASHFCALNLPATPPQWVSLFSSILNWDFLIQVWMVFGCFVLLLARREAFAFFNFIAIFLLQLFLFCWRDATDFLL